MPGPEDLPAEVQALLGTPCTEAPCDPCGPHPNVTCQVSDEGDRPTWIPARIQNADAGHLIMVPSDGSGVIGSLLAALLPPQHYSHEAIMTKDQVELRHCTASVDYLKRHPYHAPGAIVPPVDSNPTDGFAESAVRYGWPGTVTQTVDQAYRASRGQHDAMSVAYTGDGGITTQLPSTKMKTNDVPTDPPPVIPIPDELPITGMEFDPVMVPVTLPADSDRLLRAIRDGDKSPDELVAISRSATVQWTMMWPLVVRPCTHNSGPHILDALRRVAAAADYLHGHYRYHAYVDGRLGQDPTKNGPVLNEPERPRPDRPCAAKELWAHSIAQVSSVFLWEAVQEANRQGTGPRILLTHPQGDRPEHNCVPFYQPGGEDRFSPVDGLFDYDQHQTARAAAALASAIMSGIKSEQDSGPWWLSWLGDIYEAFSDIKNDTTNQLCNAFAFDRCDPMTAKDDDSWRNPPAATSVSPDNIVRSWMAPLFQNPRDEIHGLYGFNQQVVFRPGHYEHRPPKVWQYSEGPAHVDGLVTYNGQPAVGARVSLNCRTAYTDSGGAFTMDVMAGRYELDGLLYLEQPKPQPAWCAEGRSVVEIPAGSSTLPTLELHDPPGQNRIVQITGRADLVNRHTIGKDWWDHPQMSFKQLHLGNYYTQEGDQQTTSWSATIDDSYSVEVQVRATRAEPRPNDPYPVDLHVKAKLSSSGIAGWPFVPAAEEEFDLTVATDGTAKSVVDLKTGAVAPVRAHLEITFANYRQG